MFHSTNKRERILSIMENVFLNLIRSLMIGRA